MSRRKVKCGYCIDLARRAFSRCRNSPAPGGMLRRRPRALANSFRPDLVREGSSMVASITAIFRRQNWGDTLRSLTRVKSVRSSTNALSWQLPSFRFMGRINRGYSIAEGQEFCPGNAFLPFGQTSSSPTRKGGVRKRFGSCS